MSRWMGALSTRASGTQQEDHSRLRPLCYRGVDVFILSSLVSRKSCENVLKKFSVQSNMGLSTGTTFPSAVHHVLFLAADTCLQGAPS
ncbi:hypothetical protein PVAP13_4KG159900 [Panicum virgatum]|uniref:Uncharacterized protein n=1 Tax=Panicum virgatum TaxID=38727 RepID=A0A8T0TRG5_PANVG|nr:hypothetical protein PVAP13_4KG159900 [Panicum virgatum]